MRAILLLLLLAVARSLSAEPVFPPGSAIGLEPPPGFTPSASFSGFEDARTGSSLLFAELPPAAFAEIRDRFSTGALTGQGLAEIRRSTLRLAGGDALLIEGTQTLRGQAVSRWVLVLGTADVTGIVTANIMESPPRPETSAAITAALASITIRRPDPAAQRAEFPFAFDETATLRFQMVLAGTGMVIAPPDAAGMPPAQRRTAPSVIISTSLGRPAIPGDRSAFARQVFSNLQHIQDLTLGMESAPKIAGLPAIRIEARAVNAADGAPRRLVQWIAFPPEGGYLRIIAEAPEAGFDAVQPEFEQLVASLRRR